MLSHLIRPTLEALGRELAGAAVPVAMDRLRVETAKYGVRLAEPQLRATAEALSRSRSADEAAHLLERRVAAYAAGAQLGVGPIESPPPPHAAGQPAVSPGEAVFRQVAANDIDRDQREAALAPALAPAPTPLPWAWAYPSALGMAGTGAVGMYGSVPGEPDGWQKFKYVSFGVLGTGVFVCVVYTFVKALGWITERLYYPVRA